MVQQPKVSIGLPIYNGEKYLCELLNSLLAQTFTDFEIVISDNASTDKTRAICEAYQDRDKRIKYFLQSLNRGVFANVEYVMNTSNGRYFMLAGDDDYYDPSYISRLIVALEEDESVGLAFSGFGYISPDGEKAPAAFNLVLTSSDSKFSGLIKFMFRRSALPMMMGLFKREVLLKALPFRADELSPLTGDVDNIFLVNVLINCKGLKINDPLFFYRIKDRTSCYPFDWPSTANGQIFYIFKHHMRVARLIQGIFKKSDFRLTQKLLLMIINWISVTFLFVRYATNRVLKN